MARQPSPGHDNNEPLGGVVLVPLDSVAVVHWELMVKVMIAFAECDERSDEMVARRVLVVKRLFSQPMRKRIDTERGLIYACIVSINSIYQQEDLRGEQSRDARYRHKSIHHANHPRTAQEQQ